MSIFFIVSILFTQLYVPLIPTIYCTILLIFLVSLCLIITWQLGQIIQNDYVFNRLTNQRINTGINIDNTFVLAKICIKKKLWFSSIKILEAKTLTSANVQANYFNLIGLSYYNMKQYNLAKTYYLKACHQNKYYIPALQNLAKLYEVTQDNSSALQVYNLILDYDPDNIIANKRISSFKSSG